MLAVQLALPQVLKLAPLQRLQVHQAVRLAAEAHLMAEVLAAEAHLVAVADRAAVDQEARPLPRTPQLRGQAREHQVAVRSHLAVQVLRHRAHQAVKVPVFDPLTLALLPVPVPQGELAVQIRRADRRWAVLDLVQDEELRLGYAAESHEGEPSEHKVRAQVVQQDLRLDKFKESSMNQLVSKATITEA